MAPATSRKPPTNRRRSSTVSTGRSLDSTGRRRRSPLPPGSCRPACSEAQDAHRRWQLPSLLHAAVRRFTDPALVPLASLRDRSPNGVQRAVDAALTTHRPPPGRGGGNRRLRVRAADAAGAVPRSLCGSRDASFRTRRLAVVFVIVAAGLAGVVTGCDRNGSPERSSESASGSPSTPGSTPVASPDWRVVCPPAVRWCGSVQATRREDEGARLCPSKILKPPATVTPGLAFQAGPVDPAGRFYELNVTYGVPSSGIGTPQTHTPRLFFHFGLAGGRFTHGQVAFDYRLGDSGKRSARRIGPAVLSGIRGTLWMGRRWPAGGIWGGHLIFVWHRGRYRYLATLHTWLPLTQPREALARLVGSLKLAQHLG